MKDATHNFFKVNAWVWNFTFKIKQCDVSLYAAIINNQDGKGMSVFYILCMKDKNEGHEGITIELALSAVFVSIGKLRRSAVVIDKHKMSLIFINNVISNNIHYWNFITTTII